MNNIVPNIDRQSGSLGLWLVLVTSVAFLAFVFSWILQATPKLDQRFHSAQSDRSTGPQIKELKLLAANVVSRVIVSEQETSAITEPSTELVAHLEEYIDAKQPVESRVSTVSALETESMPLRMVGTQTATRPYTVIKDVFADFTISADIVTEELSTSFVFYDEKNTADVFGKNTLSLDTNTEDVVADLLLSANALTSDRSIETVVSPEVFKDEVVAADRIVADVPSEVVVAADRIIADVPSEVVVAADRIVADVPSELVVAADRIAADVPSEMVVAADRIAADVSSEVVVAEDRLITDVLSEAVTATDVTATNLPAEQLVVANITAAKVTYDEIPAADMTATHVPAGEELAEKLSTSDVVTEILSSAAEPHSLSPEFWGSGSRQEIRFNQPTPQQVALRTSGQKPDDYSSARFSTVQKLTDNSSAVDGDDIELDAQAVIRREALESLESKSAKLQFEVGSKVISEKMNIVLSDILQILSRYDDTRATIVVATNESGNSKQDIKLSQERGRAIIASLVSRGIEFTRLSMNASHDEGRLLASHIVNIVARPASK